MDVGFRQGLVDAALVCPQGTATLQQQGNAVEWQPTISGWEVVWSKLDVHDLRARRL
jgi:hypothetical protein